MIQKQDPRREEIEALDECLLLTKLPLELRQLFYHFLFRGRSFQGVFPHSSKNFKHMWSRSGDRLSTNYLPPVRYDRELTIEKGWSKVFLDKELSLMLSCRQICSESKSVLYGENPLKFELNMNTALPASSSSFPGLQAIRHLQCKWYRLYAPVMADTSISATSNAGWKAWCAVWQILGSMNSSQRLKVELDIHVNCKDNESCEKRRSSFHCKN